MVVVKKILLSPFFLSIFSGILLGIAQPIYFSKEINTISHDAMNYLGLLSLIGFVPLLLSIKENTLLKTFLLSFLSFVVYFTFCLYWIYFAVFVYGSVPSLTAASLTLGLPVILSVIYSTFITFARYISIKLNFSFLIIAPFALCALDYFRNYYLFGGFPWSSAGYSFARVDEYLQLASFVGIYGLVFFVALINSLVAFSITGAKINKFILSFVLAILLAFFIVGRYRITHYVAPSKTIDVAILQGNIEQDIKNEAYLHDSAILKIYEQMSKEAALSKVDLIIWPESAYPTSLRENITSFSLAKETNTSYIIGATTHGFATEDFKGFHYNNSALAFDFEGNIVKRYDKMHLVPFGEYVPWPMKSLVNKIVPGMGAFRPGFNQTAFKLALKGKESLKVGITICYEGIFPEISRNYAKNNADLIINLTNDAWYGVSSAPYQHLLMYRLRAVESGIPIIRSTNSGVSAWIDPIGKIHDPSDIFVRKLMIEKVPTTPTETFYTKIGDIIGQISITLLAFGFLWISFPFFYYLRQKKFISLIISSILLGSFAFFYLYVKSIPYQLDESYDTKVFLVFLVTFLGIFLVGKFTKRKNSFG